MSLIVKLVARPGQEAALERFLRDAEPLARAEAQTPVWFALRAAADVFYIVDAFPDEAGRDAHIGGAIADLLRARARELLAQPPTIERADVLVAKLPAGPA